MHTRFKFLFTDKNFLAGITETVARENAVAAYLSADDLAACARHPAGARRARRVAAALAAGAAASVAETFAYNPRLDLTACRLRREGIEWYAFRHEEARASALRRAESRANWRAMHEGYMLDPKPFHQRAPGPEVARRILDARRRIAAAPANARIAAPYGFEDYAGSFIEKCRVGVEKSVNAHITGYGKGRKWTAEWQADANRTAGMVNGRFFVRLPDLQPAELRPRLMHRLSA
jgi:hypothetical protein